MIRTNTPGSKRTTQMAIRLCALYSASNRFYQQLVGHQRPLNLPKAKWRRVDGAAAPMLLVPVPPPPSKHRFPHLIQLS